MRRRLAAVVVLLTMCWLPPVTPPPAARAASVCTGWSNWLTPPPSIRVLRTSGPSSGSVQTVDFRTYVKTVMAAEFPSSWDGQTLQAGSVAVKQYAWYFTIHYRGGTKNGSCYDVVDNTNDQVYSPETRKPITSLSTAVDASWGMTVEKNGSFIMTGYWAGTVGVACGADANGYRMYQNSAHSCGAGGMAAADILKTYYGPGAVVMSPPAGPIASFLNAPHGTTTTAGATVKASWVEETWTGRAVTGRSVTLLMAKPLGGSCNVDRWLPATPAWSSNQVSVPAASGLKAGFCYRFVISLTDSAGTTGGDSGLLLADPLAPSATFTSPALGGVTATTKSSATVSWTETPAAGTTITSRTLVEEYAPAPRTGSCAGAPWRTAWSKAAASPVAASGFLRLFCYRYRLTLADSAGHSGTWYSGVFLTPVAFS